MTLPSTRRRALAAAILIAAFGAAFAVGRASAGDRNPASAPARFVPATTHPTIRHVTSPVALPQLKPAPRKSEPASKPAEGTKQSAPAPSGPSHGGGGGGSGGGKVIVG